MKTISIYSIGSCDAETRNGSAETLLDYKGHTKYIQFELPDTTTNRCIIEGLIAGVKQLKEPCAVILITSTKIGVENAARSKGVNFGLVHSLITELQSRQCTFEFDVWGGRGDELRARIDTGRKG